MSTTAYFLVAASTLCVAQLGNNEAIQSLINKLGSNSARERETATRMLLACPESEPALRQALRSKDLEVVRRAQHILYQFDLKRLDKAFELGQIGDLIDVACSLPEGSHDGAIWAGLSRFGKKVIDLNKKESAFPHRFEFDWRSPPTALKAKRVTELTNAPPNGHYLFRAEEVDFQIKRVAKGKARNYAILGSQVIVCSGPVHFDNFHVTGSMILARGPIKCGMLNSLIICSGDVTLQGTVGRSLVIAGGKVTCHGDLLDSRIISGLSVACLGRNGNPVTENERNPLGYIHWSEPLKDKATSK